VRDIMRKGEQLATVPRSAKVREALVAMTNARAGACLVLEPDGLLAGIFTHGDFARAFQSDPGIGEKPVADFMTPDPVSVAADSLAAEALKTIGAHRVDDIVVLDSENHPVGLIDTQDLARLKIV
jgi:arabinose-5-phosphate isomerase